MLTKRQSQASGNSECKQAFLDCIFIRYTFLDCTPEVNSPPTDKNSEKKLKITAIGKQTAIPMILSTYYLQLPLVHQNMWYVGGKFEDIFQICRLSMLRLSNLLLIL